MKENMKERLQTGSQPLIRQSQIKEYVEKELSSLFEITLRLEDQLNKLD